MEQPRRVRALGRRADYCPRHRPHVGQMCQRHLRRFAHGSLSVSALPRFLCPCHGLRHVSTPLNGAKFAQIGAIWQHSVRSRTRRVGKWLGWHGTHGRTRTPRGRLSSAFFGNPRAKKQKNPYYGWPYARTN